MRAAPGILSFPPGPRLFQQVSIVVATRIDLAQRDDDITGCATREKRNRLRTVSLTAYVGLISYIRPERKSWPGSASPHK
jgi:hypothetical protein